MANPTHGLTEQLAAFCAGAGDIALNENVRRTVRNGFTDTLAVMLAGRRQEVTRIVRGFVDGRRSSVHEASVLLDVGRASARDAALVNGTAAHALDYDDVSLQGHPSAVLVSALWAEGERLHRSGLDVMRAYVVGYEVWAELVLRDPDLHHRKGWHPTAVFGVVASAAAVAALRGFDAVTARHALGLAASMSGGLIANFGSMAKPFHAGQAAANGIDACELAQAGMTAAPDALEHRAGYLAALSPRGAASLAPLAEGFGRALRIATLGLTIKKYPLCFAAHRAIDATLDLIHQHGVQADHVERVDVRIGIAQAEMLRNHRPGNALEAKFSIEFAIAAALLAGKVSLAELDDGWVARAEVQRFFDRVRVLTTDTALAHEPTLAASDRVFIEMRDGRRFDSGEVVGTRGDAQTPPGEAELRAKFGDCCEAGHHAKADALFDGLQRLDSMSDVAKLAPAGA